MSLFVESAGCGPDLVLLHGWAMHGGMWGSILHPLAQHFRLHIVDLPGHGFSRESASACTSSSAGPAGLAGFETDALARMVEMVADALPANCIVCGWSLGGQIAIELALREPVRVQKIALISTTPCFIKREDWQWGMETTTLQLFSENLKRDYATTMKRFLTLQVSGGNDSVTVLQKLRKNLFERGEPEEAALEAGIQVLLNSDLRDKLRNVIQPALLLHGENDVITHPDAARWMKQRLRNSELLMLPACGHAPFLSYPDEFVASMVRFARFST